MGHRGSVKSVKLYPWHSVCVHLCMHVCLCVCVCPVEKALAPHSSVLAWRIPGTGEPHGLPSVGSHRVGHDTEAT